MIMIGLKEWNKKVKITKKTKNVEEDQEYEDITDRKNGEN